MERQQQICRLLKTELVGDQGKVLIKPLLLILLLGAMAGLFFFMLQNWTKLGITAPQIELVEVPRGIGITPVNMVMRLSSASAGLSHVIVSVQQRGQAREIINQSLAGQEQETLTLDFPGPASDLEEGLARFSIWVKDLSYLGRSKERQISLLVDYQRPKVEALAVPDSIKAGGTQLILFRAFDEALAVAGVKIDNYFSAAFPARIVDPDFKDEDLMALFFTVPTDFKAGTVAARLFAEDRAGNTNSVTFNLRVVDRQATSTSFEIGSAYLRRVTATLFDQNRDILERSIREGGESFSFKFRQGSEQRLLEQFMLINDQLRQLNTIKIGSYLANRGFERSWAGKFERPYGRIQGSFAEEVSFHYGNEVVQKVVQQGVLFLLPPDQKEVQALNSGVVVFVDTLGVYGRAVGISHGMGLASVYGFLESATVKQGEFVQAGQAIGQAGISGLGNGQQLLLEMRLNGQQIDPTEWWDQRWFQANITKPINRVRRLMGLPIRTRVN